MKKETHSLVPKSGVINNTGGELKKIGEDTYKNNEVMSLITDVMSDTTFRELFNKYFNNWDEIKTILMIMKIFQSVENNQNITGKKLNKEEILGAVQKIIADRDMRLSVVNAMDAFMNADIIAKNIKSKAKKIEKTDDSNSN